MPYPFPFRGGEIVQCPIAACSQPDNLWAALSGIGKDLLDNVQLLSCSGDLCRGGGKRLFGSHYPSLPDDQFALQKRNRYEMR